MLENEITFDKFIRGLMVVAGIGLAIYIINLLSSVLLPFFIAWFLAYMIYPTVKFFQYKLRLRNRIVSIVATLLLYFAWSTPISQLSGASENWAAVGDHSIFGPAETPRPHQAVDRKPLPVVSAPQPSAPGSETPAVAAPENRPATTAPAEEAGRYSLVLASAIPLANAEAYAEQLKSAGHDDVFVYRKRRMVRVLCGHFADEATAYAHLRKLRDDAEFADAWVIELK